MDRWTMALLLGVLGGLAGGLGVHFLFREAPAREASPGADDGTQRQVREEIAALSAKVDRLASQAGPSVLRPTGHGLGRGPGAAAGGPAAGAPGSGPASGTGIAFTNEQMDAIAAKAAEAVMAKQAEKEAAAKPPEKKRASIAEISRDLNLLASQEDEIRRAYADSREKYLKLMAEPDGDVESVRRDLEATKDNPAKKTEVMLKYLPKVVSKFGEMFTIESERTARVNKALGPENAKKFGAYKVEEEDPFGLDATLSVGDGK